MVRLLPLLLAVLSMSPGTTAAPAPPGPAVWPTGGASTVVREFDPPPRPWLAGHRGVDLLVSPGQVIRSPTSGTIVVAGVVVDRPVVVVQSGDRRITLEPVSPLLPVGARVSPGDPVGTIADEGGHCPPRVCLHWGLRVAGTYHDPLLLLGRHRAVLLPSTGG